MTSIELFLETMNATPLTVPLRTTSLPTTARPAPAKRHSQRARVHRIFAVASIVLFLTCGACTPHVIVEAPDKPIEININAKISHEVKIKVEKDVEDLVKQNDKKLF